MGSKAFPSFVLLAMLLPSAALAIGPVVFDNGAPNFQGGNEMTRWIQTEGFRLGASTTVSAVEFWTLEDGAQYDGTLQWWIFGDNAGTPGSVLSTGVVSGPSRTATGRGVEYDYQFNITPFAASANTVYHLGLHVNTTRDFAWDCISWELTDRNGTNTGIESYQGTMDNWYNNGREHAFKLYGTEPQVPEPWAIFLALPGLASVRILLRRK